MTMTLTQCRLDCCQANDDKDTDDPTFFFKREHLRFDPTGMTGEQMRRALAKQRREAGNTPLPGVSQTAPPAVKIAALRSGRFISGRAAACGVMVTDANSVMGRIPELAGCARMGHWRGRISKSKPPRFVWVCDECRQRLGELGLA